MTQIKSWLQGHPLIQSLLSLKGNPKTCILTEPLWGIPAALFTPYMSVYMAAFGLSDVQIAQVAAGGLIFQFFTALLGGVITDRLGRRLTTFIFDTLSWSVPVFLWLLADSYEVFAAAALANAFLQITANSWVNLLVEDAPKDELVNIFTWCTVAGLLSVFFAPAAGALIRRLGLVPGLRIVFGFSLVMMTAKFILTWFFTRETKTGRERMEQVRELSFGRQIREYIPLMRRMFRDKRIIFVLFLLIMVQSGQTVTNNFFSLYVTRHLGIPDSFLSYFPMLRAGIMLFLIFTVQTRLNRLPFRIPLASGLVLYMAAQLLLLSSPRGSVPLLLLYTAVEALAYALVIPQRDTLLNTFIDQKERARQLAVMNAFTVALSAPLGYVSGLLSAADGRLPFVLNILCYAACLLLMLPAKLRE